MKKLVFLLSIALFITTISQAQINQDEEFMKPANGIGVRGGMNFSKIDSDLGANTVRTKTYHAGVFFQYNFSEFFAIQPEIQWSKEGWIYEDPTGDRTTTLNYLNLTTVAKAYITSGLNFQAGLANNLLIDASDELPTGKTHDASHYFKRYNLGAVFGIAFDTPFGLRLGGRYVQGLININKEMGDGYPASTKDNEIKTTNFQLFIGYSFSLPQGRVTYGAN